MLSTYAQHQAVRRTVVPARIDGEMILLAGLPGAHWQEDVATRPVAIAQAHPGPLAVRVRRAEEPEVPATGPSDVTWHVATATGAVGPEMVAPDEIWMWALLPVVWSLIRRRTR